MSSDLFCDVQTSDIALGSFVYIACAGSFLALDLETGVVRWRSSFGNSSTPSGCVMDASVDNSIIVDQANNQIYLTALDVSPPLMFSGTCVIALSSTNGQIIWKQVYQGAVTSPIVYDDTSVFVAITSTSPRIISLDLVDGTEVWRQLVPMTFPSPQESDSVISQFLLITHGILYFAVSNDTSVLLLAMQCSGHLFDTHTFASGLSRSPVHALSQAPNGWIILQYECNTQVSTCFVLLKPGYDGFSSYHYNYSSSSMAIGSDSNIYLLTGANGTEPAGNIFILKTPSMQQLWPSSDLDLFSFSSLSSLTLSENTITVTTSNSIISFSAVPVPPYDDEPTDHRPVYIIVGVVLSVVLVGAIAFVCWKNKSNKDADETEYVLNADGFTGK